MPMWTKVQLKEAVQKVKARQMSMNKAARVYGIPVSILHSHVHAGPEAGGPGRVGAGRPTI